MHFEIIKHLQKDIKYFPYEKYMFKPASLLFFFAIEMVGNFAEW